MGHKIKTKYCNCSSNGIKKALTRLHVDNGLLKGVLWDLVLAH